MMATETEQLILIRRPWGETLVGLMRNDFATDHRRERYVVEVDGRAKAEYLTFYEGADCRIEAQARVSQEPDQIARRGHRDRALRRISVQGLTFMLVPFAHMTIILLVGLAGFYLMHVFAR
jgi:hypothetical protein